MISISTERRWLRLLTAAGVSALAGFWAPAHAQDEEAPPAEDADAAVEEAESEAAREDTIVVTGSRVRRDSFTSTAPLQVIDSETIAEAGLVDVGEILRQTTVVQGVQLDLQVNANFVTNAGPGGQTVGLRGLQPERTLVLINGRRFAPAGVEGAPTLPDISLIPSAMIERVDILLDGASSVYGSDAVAGVTNIILRSQFDGVAVEFFRSNPEDTGGAEQQYSLLMGAAADKAKFVLGAEYVHNEELRGNERDWMGGPNVDCNGNPVSREQPAGAFLHGSIDIVQCPDGSVHRSIGTGHSFQSFLAFPFGAILLGRPNTANPAFGLFPHFEIANLAGNFNGLFAQGFALNQDEMLLPEFQRASVYLTADYDLAPGANAFLEFNFSDRQTTFQDGWQVMDVVVTPDNPYQLEAFAGFRASSNFTARPLQPWRDNNFVELQQFRSIGGLRGSFGDLGAGDMGWFRSSQWDYELFFGYSRSQGFSSREILREEAFLRSLDVEIDPATGAIVCKDVPNPTGPFSPGQTLEPCIPFNPLFPGLYPIDGSFPFPEDPRIIDYLRGVRTVTTFVDQVIAGGYLTGPVVKLPAGDLQGVVGFEWREDAIDTRSDDTAARGLGSGFFLDRPTTGAAALWEVFGELVVPLVAGRPFANEVSLEMAGRLTSHEFYGENTTYSVRGRWSPFDWLTFRSTAGTSFRAPNLRELFLAGQSGFAVVPDPCLVPGPAQLDTNGDGVADTYDPGPNGENDPRTQQVIDNCTAEGLDPFSLGIGISPGTPEVFRAGNTGLDPETSFAWSAGVVFEQPFFDDLDVRVGFTYWDINITGAVLVPSAAFLVAQCYDSPNFPDDPFCTRRQRDPNTGFLDEVDATPFNIAEEAARGFDINLHVGKDFRLGDQAFRAELDVVSTYTGEISQTIVLEGTTEFEDDAGDVGNPYWRATANARLRWNDWTLFWRGRYIGETQSDSIPANCVQPRVLECFTVADILYHDMSLNWTQETWTLRVGVNNLFDTDPPQLDEDVGETTDQRNVPAGLGYDRIGRRFFVNVTKQF